jgi:chitinase
MFFYIKEYCMTYLKSLNKCMLAFIFMVQTCTMSILFAQGAERLDAYFVVESDWGTGYQMRVTLKNPSLTPTHSWSVSFNLESSQEQIRDVLNAVYSVDGSVVRVTNPTEENGGVIPSQGTASFVLVVDNAAPQARTLLNLYAIANGAGITIPTLNPISLRGRSNYIVSWSAVPEACAYTLQQAQDADFMNPVIITRGPATSRAFFNQPDGTYYYRASAASCTEDSPFGAARSITVGLTAPATLQAPVLQAINNLGLSAYQIVWSAVQGAQTYKLEESMSSSFSDSRVLANTAVTSYQVSNQAQGTYYYRVTALAGSVESPASTVQTATVTQEPQPQPTGARVEGFLESWNGLTPLGTILNMKADVVSVAYATLTRTGAHTFAVIGLDIDQQELAQFITAAHAAGKKVKVSIGGAAYRQAPFLQSVVDAHGMAQAVARYVQENGFDGVDFTIQDAPVAEYQVAVLQKTRELLGANALISYTPKTPTSSTEPYSQVVRDAHQHLSSVDMMAYNGAADYDYQADVQALIAAGVPASKLALGLMPGSDDLGQVTSLDKVRAVAQYAKDNGLSGVSLWSLNRDIENRTELGASAATDASAEILHS